jgi:hypothetical protein
MDSNIFSHFYFLMRPDFPVREDINASYEIAPGDEKGLEGIFEHVFSKETPAFNITFTLPAESSGAVDTKCLNRISLILCHPQYLNHQGKLVITILPDPGAQHAQQFFLRQLGLELKKQGFETLFVDLSQREKSKLRLPFYYFNERKDDDDFSIWYLRTLQDTGSALYLFYPYPAPEAARDILEQRTRVEISLKSENPLLHQLIANEVAFSRKRQELEAVISDLKANIASKSEYLDFLMGKNASGELGESTEMVASMKIKKFYHQEYEVLPLWYKRVGHIIKVLTRKRTLRSLYDDKAPKYKK